MIRNLFLSALLALALPAAATAFADDLKLVKNPHGADFARHGIPGSLNPRTGAFQPAPPDAVSPDASATREYKVTVNITVLIRTPGMGMKTIECDAISQPDPTGEDDYDVRRVFVSVATSATKATCTVTTNVRWMIDTASSKLFVDIGVFGYDSAGNEVRAHEQTIGVFAGDPLPGPGGASYTVAVAF